MKGEIQAAADWLGERYRAVDLDAGVQSEAAAEKALRCVYSGLDLDFEELQEFGQHRQAQAALMIVAVADPTALARAYLSEGIALGLRIAEQREKAGAEK